MDYDWVAARQPETHRSYGGSANARRHREAALAALAIQMRGVPQFNTPSWRGIADATGARLLRFCLQTAMLVDRGARPAL